MFITFSFDLYDNTSLHLTTSQAVNAVEASRFKPNAYEK
jgi:hypothetical protein